MTEQETRKGGGSKLLRSETVTVRLDQKLRYLAELAARKQRRTLSSYIEWALENSLKSVVLYQGSGYNNDRDESVADEAEHLWDVDEAERFMRLAIYYPDLLSHQEQEIWKLVHDSHLLMPALSRENGRLQWNHTVLAEEVFPAIRRRWPELMAAYETGSSSARSEWAERAKADVIGGKVYGDRWRAPDPLAKSESEAFHDDIPF